MSRRIALPISFVLTILVAFAVTSFASQAGWLQADSGEPDVVEAEALPPTDVPPPAALDPLVITEYVYEDVPVVVSRAPAGQPETVVTPEPQAVVVTGSGNESSAQQEEPVANSSEADSPVGEPASLLAWSHDGDGDDQEDFEDEIEDRRGEQEEHHEDEHEDHQEHEEDD